MTWTFSLFINVYTVLASALIIIYVFLGPLLHSYHHTKRYWVLLPIPYAGAWIISIMFFSAFNLPFLLSSFLVSIIPALLVSITHFYSRMKNVVALGRYTARLSNLARIFFAESSLIFLVMGLSILGLEIVKLEPINKVILYGTLIAFYCFSTLTYINSAYRYRLLCRALSTNNVGNKTDELFRKLKDKFPKQEDDVNLLRYYLSEALLLFEEVSYEMAYFSAYKIIRDKTVVGPTKYVSDKRGAGELSFSDIRAILLHSGRKRIEISPKVIAETRSKLPEYALEVIQRALEFIEKLAYA